jgi:GTPase SAR1 family protein
MAARTPWLAAKQGQAKGTPIAVHDADRPDENLAQQLELHDILKQEEDFNANQDNTEEILRETESQMSGHGVAEASSVPQSAAISAEPPVAADGPSIPFGGSEDGTRVSPPYIPRAVAAAGESADVPGPGFTPTVAKLGSPVAMIVLGMAGSGKTTLMQRLHSHVHMRGWPGYSVNLDPAVMHLPFTPNIDIRDSVKYKEVMKQYGLGPNGAIMTSLNLFATRFDQVLSLVEKRRSELQYVMIDTPGQIEVFTWSASGTIITDSLASTVPTVLVYVVDAPRSISPVTFMSNMLYACSIMYKAQLPFVIALNKSDVARPDFALEWMADFEAFQAALDADEDESYVSNLTRSMALVLDEFYSTITAVPVSAVTGEGMDELFAAVDDAAAEYYEQYKPRLDKVKAERATAAAVSHSANISRLQKDMGVPDGALVPEASSQGGEPVLSLKDVAAVGAQDMGAVHASSAPASSGVAVSQLDSGHGHCGRVLGGSGAMAVGVAPAMADILTPGDAARAAKADSLLASSLRVAPKGQQGGASVMEGVPRGSMADDRGAGRPSAMPADANVPAEEQASDAYEHDTGAELDEAEAVEYMALQQQGWIEQMKGKQ